jgi:hypothetical protein
VGTPLSLASPPHQLESRTPLLGRKRSRSDSQQMPAPNNCERWSIIRHSTCGRGKQMRRVLPSKQHPRHWWVLANEPKCDPTLFSTRYCKGHSQYISTGERGVGITVDTVLRSGCEWGCMATSSPGNGNELHVTH